MWSSPSFRQASPQAGKRSTWNCAGEWSTETAPAGANAQRVVSASPRHFRPCVRRPVSGLTSLDVSPSQTFAQWHIDTPTLAYRCGDSTGLVSNTRTCFPFNRDREPAWRHLAQPLPPVRPSGGEHYNRILAASTFIATECVPQPLRPSRTRGCALTGRTF